MFHYSVHVIHITWEARVGGPLPVNFFRRNELGSKEEHVLQGRWKVGDAGIINVDYNVQSRLQVRGHSKPCLLEWAALL